VEFCAASGKTNFVLWMQPVSGHPYAAKCIWCTKTVDLSNMQRQALVSHMSSSWRGMTLDIWRSLLRILFVAIASGKVKLWLWKTQEFFILLFGHPDVPSVLWCCWLSGRKGIRPVKTEWWGTPYWHGYLSGARCKWFAYGPADATATPLSLVPVKSRMVYLFSRIT